MLNDKCCKGMSLKARREYLSTMRTRYLGAKTRSERSAILDEVVKVTGYNRKYAIRALRPSAPSPGAPRTRKRPRRYLDCLYAISLAWEALDYCCAERLHLFLLSIAQRLTAFGVLPLAPSVQQQLSSISRATLARYLKSLPNPKSKRVVSPARSASIIRSKIPIARYDWNESRPGALEIDLVEHNGGSSHGLFAYTLSVVDTVSGWSSRRAVLGKGQRGIHAALAFILSNWPFSPWGLHSDNGPEFLNDMLLRFAHSHALSFTRSCPCRKNDNAHVEQKNRALVREIVGYQRYDSLPHIEWLNAVYDLPDVYANLVLPSMKVIAKTRSGARVHKTFDTPATPLDRLIRAGALSLDNQSALLAHAEIEVTDRRRGFVKRVWVIVLALILLVIGCSSGAKPSESPGESGSSFPLSSGLPGPQQAGI